MDFAMIGKVSSFVKQKNLFFAANYKIKTGQRVVDSNGNLQFAKKNMFDEMLKTKKKSDSGIDSARISGIKQKLMNGRKLTTEELSFLKEKDPNLYKKAKKAEDSREELKNNLKNAKTKQDARKILTQAMIKTSAEASAELAACKSSINSGGGEIFSQTFSEVGENFSANFSESSPSFIQANEKISENGEQMTQATTEITKLEIQSENNSAENSSKKVSDDILEKFIMTIRALEDEWTNFTKSKEYDDLPDDYFGEKNSKKPEKKFLDAILIYRNAMINS